MCPRQVRDTLTELSYSQLWALVGEGHVAEVRFYGPSKRSVLLRTHETAPGGVRVCKVGAAAC